MAEIAKIVSEFYGVSIIDMKSNRRAAEVCHPRQVCFFLARELTLLSYPQMGRFFGGRDHCTILHGARKIGDLARKNPRLKDEIDLLRIKIGEIMMAQRGNNARPDEI